MKRKIRIIDKINNTIIEHEYKTRDLVHLEVQKKYRATWTKDKTKYTRKLKYKPSYNFKKVH